MSPKFEWVFVFRRKFFVWSGVSRNVYLSANQSQRFETLTHNWTFRASQSYLYSSFPLRLTICDGQYSRQGVRDEPNANYRIVTFRKSSFFSFKKCAEVFKQRTAKLFFFKHFPCSLNDAHPFLHLDASALEKRLIAFSFLCVYR